ncbi:DUF6777 domain-containing protein [Nocardia salmonicida]|uniref:DUF6777 domain-containing protein n=1 Tax=Nocardia salmonicida TaxID=53431 RepID=UPI0033EFE550
MDSGRRGAGESSRYSADASRADGVLVGEAGTQINHFYRNDSSGWRLTRLGVLVLVMATVVLASGAVAATVVLTNASSSLGSPELFLEPSDLQGHSPFMPTPPRMYWPDGSQPVLELPSTSGSAAAKPFAGDTAGLYGAPRDQVPGDRDDMIAFYGAHPEQASGAAQVLRDDAAFKWSGGQRIDGSDLVRYLRELTPALLRIDVRVTDHLWVNGRAVPRQSILQAGTAVLLDSHGVPRFRSLSGSPLTLPSALAHTPTIVGTPWPGYAPEQVVAISPCATPLTRITLIDSSTGQPFDRPVGTAGEVDIDHADWPGAATSPVPAPSATAPAKPGTSAVPDPPEPLDLSGLWAMGTANGGDLIGTVQQTPEGFLFHNDRSIPSLTVTLDCLLKGRVGESVEMTCRQHTVSYSGLELPENTDSSYQGTLTPLRWNGRPKFRFDGKVVSPVIASLGQYTVTLAPQ